MSGVENSGDARQFLIAENCKPRPETSGLDTPYWEASRESRLLIQRCRECRRWQWGPEWTCHSCTSFEIEWSEVPVSNGKYRGSIYSWERVWHATDPRLKESVPYVVVLVELPAAGSVRMIGNLIGDPLQTVEIGTPVTAVFEHHPEFSLVHWERVEQ